MGWDYAGTVAALSQEGFAQKIPDGILLCNEACIGVLTRRPDILNTRKGGRRYTSSVLGLL